MPLLVHTAVRDYTTAAISSWRPFRQEFARSSNRSMLFIQSHVSSPCLCALSPGHGGAGEADAVHFPPHVLLEGHDGARSHLQHPPRGDGGPSNSNSPLRRRMRALELPQAQGQPLVKVLAAPYISINSGSALHTMNTCRTCIQVALVSTFRKSELSDLEPVSHPEQPITQNLTRAGMSHPQRGEMTPSNLDLCCCSSCTWAWRPRQEQW